MFELEFVFDFYTAVKSEKLKGCFKKCRSLSFFENDTFLKITMDSGSDNWGNMWAAVWSLTEKEWFVSSVKSWELTVSENNSVFREDLLSYCLKKEKGLFRSSPE